MNNFLCLFKKDPSPKGVHFRLSRRHSFGSNSFSPGVIRFTSLFSDKKIYVCFSDRVQIRYGGVSLHCSGTAQDIVWFDKVAFVCNLKQFSKEKL